MKYSFNVMCDSSNNYSHINGSTTSFNFDWTLVPDKNYDLTFSYMSDDVTVTLSPIMTLWADFNGVEQNYIANGDGARKINCLGALRTYGHGANVYYWADTLTNPPTRIQRPSNNIFTISLNNALTTVPYATPVAGQYVLTLHFEECDE
jgi:hypothetical protein